MSIVKITGGAETPLSSPRQVERNGQRRAVVCLFGLIRAQSQCRETIAVSRRHHSARQVHSIPYQVMLRTKKFFFLYHSLPQCYASEFGPLNVDNERGMPFEQLLGFMKNVNIVPAHHFKLVQLKTNDHEEKGSASLKKVDQFSLQLFNRSKVNVEPIAHDSTQHTEQ